MPDAPGTLFYTGTTCWYSVDLENNTVSTYGDCEDVNATKPSVFFEKLVQVNDTAFLGSMRGEPAVAVGIVNFASGAPVWQRYNLNVSLSFPVASSSSVGYVATVASVSQIVPFDVHTGQAWPPLGGLPLVYGFAVWAGFLFCSVKKEFPASPDFLVYNITDTVPVLLHKLTLDLQLKLLSVDGNVIAAASFGLDGDGVAVLSVDVSGSVQVVANIGMEDTPHALTLTAGRVYVTSLSASVMWVLAVSDLSDVGFLRTALLLQIGVRFTICGDMAYVKNGVGQVEVIDLWDDTASPPTPVPQTAAPPQTASPASLVTVATNHTAEVVPGGHSNLVSCVVPDVLFYVEAGCWRGVNLASQGVTTYSCGTDVVGEAHRVNDTAVVFLRAGGVQVVDFGSGVRETSFAATAVGVAIGNDSFGYLVSGTQHIDVVPFDARSGTLYAPLTPRNAGAPLSTAAYDNLLFVSIAQVDAAATDLLMYDTTNRTHPSLLHELVIGVQMSAMAASATRIVGIGADNTLNVFEVHTDGVRWLAAFRINGVLSNLALSGSVVYFTSGALLYEVDTSEPDDVRISRALSLLSEATTLSVCDETVYVATEAGLEVVARWVATGVPSAHTAPPASDSTTPPASAGTALPASDSTAPQIPAGDSTAATHTTYTVLYVLGGVAGGMVIASVLMCLASRGLRRAEPSAVMFNETTEPLSNPLTSNPVSGSTLYVEAEELTEKEVVGENAKSLLL